MDKRSFPNGIRPNAHSCEQLFEKTPDLICGVDPEGIIQVINPACKKILGYTQEELVGTRFLDYVHPNDLEATQQVFQDMHHNIGEGVIDNRWKSQSGQYVWLSWHGLAYLNDGLYYGLARDVTRYQEAIKETNRATHDKDMPYRQKSDFMAKMTHEIRTPLNSILGFTELMQGEGLYPHEVQQYSAMAHQSAHMLLDFINHILDLSKIESGSFQLNPQAVELDPLISDVCLVILPLSEKKNLDFQLKLDIPDHVSYWLDAPRLRQVLMNLLGNAVKFTAEGSVTLSVTTVAHDRPTVSYEGTSPSPWNNESYTLLETSPHTLVFTVEDTGIGIPQEDHHKIFEDYYQHHASKNKRVEGTGLGLAICQQLLTMMDSTLTINSEMGIGTSFSFTLSLPALTPLATPKTQNPSTSPASRASLSQPSFHENSAPRPTSHLALPKVLVVDNQPMNQALLQHMLAPWGFDVRLANSGQQALALYQSEPADLIFMDYDMPGLNGIETAQSIRHLEKIHFPGKQCLIFITTAYTPDYFQPDALDQTFDGFLEKPLSIPKLTALIQEHFPEFVPYCSLSLNESSSDPLDWGAMIEISGNNRELAADLVYGFYNEAQYLLQALQDVIQDGKEDSQEFKRLTHELKGVSLNYRANHLGAMAKALDENLPNIPWAERQERMDQLLQAFDELTQYLEQQGIINITPSSP